MQRYTATGHLGSDPELKTVAGSPVCNMSLAVDTSYTDRDGERVERTLWWDVEAWGRLAEVCQDYLSKGRKILVEGEIKEDSWETDAGETRRKKKLRAQSVEFLGSTGNSQNASSSQQGAPAGQDSDDAFEADADLPF